MVAKTNFDLNERDLAVKLCAEQESLRERVKELETSVRDLIKEPLATTSVEHKVLEKRVELLEHANISSKAEQKEYRRFMSALFAVSTLIISTVLVLIEIFTRG